MNIFFVLRYVFKMLSDANLLS